MSTTDILVGLGTGALTIIAVLVFIIARTNGYLRYGREALFVWVAMCAMLISVRVLRDYVGLLSQSDAVNFASTGYLATLFVLLQIVVILRRGIKT